MTNDIIEHVEIKNVVILDSDSAGDMYMQKLFPYWVDVTVFTIEGKYPINPLLRQRVINELETNENLFCFTFGSAADKYKCKTQKKLRMAPIFFKDLTFNKWSQSVLQLNEEKIIALMMAFVGDTMSRLKAERIEKYNTLIKTAEPDSVKWYHSLICA